MLLLDGCCVKLLTTGEGDLWEQVQLFFAERQVQVGINGRNKQTKLHAVESAVSFTNIASDGSMGVAGRAQEQMMALTPILAPRDPGC